MALVSHQGRFNTQGSIVPFCAMSVRSHRDFVYPSCSTIQENAIFDRTNDQFSLEVLTPMGDAILNIGI
jgi:hypothetical protein